jgi:hypothetical protein
MRVIESQGGLEDSMPARGRAPVGDAPARQPAEPSRPRAAARGYGTPPQPAPRVLQPNHAQPHVGVGASSRLRFDRPSSRWRRSGRRGAPWRSRSRPTTTARTCSARAQRSHRRSQPSSTQRKALSRRGPPSGSRDRSERSSRRSNSSQSHVGPGTLNVGLQAQQLAWAALGTPPVDPINLFGG